MLRVKIKNFQSVADTDLEIDKFTVIVGKNNKGKSAIVRAIDAALSNKLGSNFIKWGKNETQVNIQNNNLDITWVKNDSAFYKIKDISKDPEKVTTYTSLKGAVPESITNAGFKKLEVADEKLNPLIAHQFEELFLINRSGSFVTEVISTLYELNPLNDADTLCQKKLRAAKSLLKTRQTDLENIQEKLQKFDGLEEIKKSFETIKNLNVISEKLKIEINELQLFEKQVFNQTESIKKLEEIKKIKIPKTDDLYKKLKEYEWLISVLKEFHILKNIVEKLNEIKYIKVPNTQKVGQLIEEHEWLVTISKNIKTLIISVQNLKKIYEIKIPDIFKINNLTEELALLNNLVEDLKIKVLSFNKLKIFFPEIQKIKIISDKLKNINEQVIDIDLLNKIYADFITIKDLVEGLNLQLQTAKNEYSNYKKEFDTFQVCPLCDKPLNLDHNHG